MSSVIHTSMTKQPCAPIHKTTLISRHKQTQALHQQASKQWHALRE